MLVLAYILVTLLVQAARFIKRFYVRRFANNINRRMKGVLYANLVRQSRAALEKEGAGELMTKAISDVDDCVEGMRKFTTEVFDTGVALVGYIVMLLVYDWRLALLSLLFTPVSYVCAGWDEKAGAARQGRPTKRQRALCAPPRWTVPGTPRPTATTAARPPARNGYEDVLKNYERTAVRSNVWQSALPPLYLACVRGGRAVYLVVRREERPGHRLVRLGHRRVHDVFVLLHQTGRSSHRRWQSSSTPSKRPKFPGGASSP